jgi:hypothetical protein
MSEKLEIIKLKYKQMSTEKLQETFDLYSELQSMSTTDQIHYDCICQELDKRGMGIIYD